MNLNDKICVITGSANGIGEKCALKFAEYGATLFLIDLDEKITLVTPNDTVLASVTHAMKEIEPVVEVDEDELFLDEEGEPIEGDETEKEVEKPTEGGEEKPAEKNEKKTDSK